MSLNNINYLKSGQPYDRLDRAKKNASRVVSTGWQNLFHATLIRI
jgi:hypothetical protein